jgi:Mn-dependent DtxR family transcriptional regulator
VLAKARKVGSGMTKEWSVLTNYAWVLVCIAADPEVRLRDVAARLGITERTASGIVTELTKAGTSSR